jgi:hypothetical protein
LIRNADGRDMLCDPDLALPRLTYMHKLYEMTNPARKLALLKKVFERGLVYDDAIIRTPYIHSSLMHNGDNIQEKGLLMIEQPYEVLLF